MHPGLRVVVGGVVAGGLDNLGVAEPCAAQTAAGAQEVEELLVHAGLGQAEHLPVQGGQSLLEIGGIAAYGGAVRLRVRHHVPAFYLSDTDGRQQQRKHGDTVAAHAVAAACGEGGDVQGDPPAGGLGQGGLRPGCDCQGETAIAGGTLDRLGHPGNRAGIADGHHQGALRRTESVRTGIPGQVHGGQDLHRKAGERFHSGLHGQPRRVGVAAARDDDPPQPVDLGHGQRHPAVPLDLRTLAPDQVGDIVDVLPHGVMKRTHIHHIRTSHFILLKSRWQVHPQNISAKTGKKSGWVR